MRRFTQTARRPDLLSVVPTKYRVIRRPFSSHIDGVQSNLINLTITRHGQRCLANNAGMQVEGRCLEQCRRTISYDSVQAKESIADEKSVMDTSTIPILEKTKKKRSSGSPRSRRTVTGKGQTSKQTTILKNRDQIDGHKNTITAICVAEEYDMAQVVTILRKGGYSIDPHCTGYLDDQVIHSKVDDMNGDAGHIFVFPSGTLVAWSLSEDAITELATKTLLPATINPHIEQAEMEDLEFREDAQRENSNIRGDIITLGTMNSELDTTLTRIAFSSALARSAKLGTLENTLDTYFDSTRQFTKSLAQGARLPTRTFLLRKIGALLELRAQLNHYSELTDSLPDLFWDSRHELNLENYFDQVGRNLDIVERIRTLNQRMDYAQEIASIMRQTLSEEAQTTTQEHSTRLEWIIIWLITIEVVFGVRHIWREHKKDMKKLEKEALQKEVSC